MASILVASKAPVQRRGAPQDCTIAAALPAAVEYSVTAPSCEVRVLHPTPPPPALDLKETARACQLALQRAAADCAAREGKLAYCDAFDRLSGHFDALWNLGARAFAARQWDVADECLSAALRAPCVGQEDAAQLRESLGQVKLARLRYSDAAALFKRDNRCIDDLQECYRRASLVLEAAGLSTAASYARRQAGTAQASRVLKAVQRRAAQLSELSDAQLDALRALAAAFDVLESTGQATD